MSSDIWTCKKIAIIGPVASGKSTLAKRLGEMLDLPVFHLDNLWNLPNGEKEHPDILEEKIKNITLGEKWIIDGNYRDSLYSRFELSDLVIWLNFSLEFCRESAIARHFESKHVGKPEYFVEPDDVLLFNFEENLKTAEQYIFPLAEKYREKLIELTTREQVDMRFRKELQREK